MSFYSVGVGALNAAQLGLTTAGHNIANVNTEGYHRQVVSQATNVPIMTGSGFVGQGAHVDTIKRVYSQFLDSQVSQAQTEGAYLDTYQVQIKQIDNILADPSAGLSPALQDFFKAVGDVATSPQSIPSRQSLISGATALTTRFQTLDLRFSELRDGLNSQISSAVGNINSLAQQIANVNTQIVVQTSNSNQPANDLLDTRDTLISQLNQLVRATVVRQDDGTFNVFIGNGQPLVIGQQTFNLSATPSPEDQGRIEVGYQSGAGTIILPNGSLSGGTLGGLLDFRVSTLDVAQNSLGRIAMSIAQDFNNLQAIGQDLNGVIGQDFFDLPTPTVIPSVKNTGTGTLTGVVDDASVLTLSNYKIQVTGTGPNSYSITNLTTNAITAGYNDATLVNAIPGVQLTLGGVWSPAVGDVFGVMPTRDAAKNISLSSTISAATIAAAAPMITSATTANTGTGKISAGSVDQATQPPLNAAIKNTVRLVFTSATTFDVIDDTAATTLATGVAYTPTGDISFNGWITQISGIPATGDTFTIAANTSGVSDNRNALLMAKLQTANRMEPGGSGTLTTSYQGAYSQMVSQVGNKAAEVNVTAQAQQNLLTQARNSQQALSGVNLDEEAASLLRYQQAYQAAGKMMQIASNMFDTLLSLGN